MSLRFRLPALRNCRPAGVLRLKTRLNARAGAPRPGVSVLPSPDSVLSALFCPVSAPVPFRIPFPLCFGSVPFCCRFGSVADAVNHAFVVTFVTWKAENRAETGLRAFGGGVCFPLGQISWETLALRNRGFGCCSCSCCSGYCRIACEVKLDN